MASVLIYADTVRSPELRHEVPHAVPDPFLYAEHGGRRFAFLGSLEVARMREVPGIEPTPLEELGLDELRAAGLAEEEIRLELPVRACRRLGLERATVPPSFPLALADRLRADGVELDVDAALFATRRRSKAPREIAGIRRAQSAAEAAMAAVAEILRRAPEGEHGQVVLVDGEPLTSERLKVAVARAFADNDASAEDCIVAHGAQTSIGHHMGAGEIRYGEPITVDLWPRDRESGYHTDMTRTFVVGEPSDELREYHRLCLAALERACALIRPGALTRDVHVAACEVFEAAGQPTLLSKKPGEVLHDGFFHALGHGVGLEVHEPPRLGLSQGELVAGDVVAVEPGCYRQGLGGVRVEDLVVVRDDGPEVLTSYPYGLSP